MTDFVLLAVADRAGRLLFQERDEHAPVAPDRWGLPGGALEPGEQPADAAARELAEETGITGLDLVDLGRHRFYFAEAGAWYEYALFAAHTDLRDADVQCHEGRQIVFRAPRELHGLPLTTATTDALPVLLDADWHAQTEGEPLAVPGPGREFASVLLVDDRGHILLQERDEHARIDPERWGLAGGHVEPGESSMAAAVRELEEETGVRLAEQDLTHVRRFRVYHPVYDTVDTLEVYAARVSLSDGDLQCREGRQIVFVAPATALRLPLTDSARQVVPLFLDSPLYDTMTT